MQPGCSGSKSSNHSSRSSMPKFPKPTVKLQASKGNQRYTPQGGGFGTPKVKMNFGSRKSY